MDSLPAGLSRGYVAVREDFTIARGVRVLVPSVVLGRPADDSLYVIVPQVDDSSYSVFYSRDYSCVGGGGCRDGSVTGERLGRDSPALDAGRPVAIASGVRGTYVRPKCGGAGCSEPLLWWATGNYRYSVGLKGGSENLLVRMARSMVPLDSAR